MKKFFLVLACLTFFSAHSEDIDPAEALKALMVQNPFIQTAHGPTNTFAYWWGSLLLQNETQKFTVLTCKDSDCTFTVSDIEQKGRENPNFSFKFLNTNTVEVDSANLGPSTKNTIHTYSFIALLENASLVVPGTDNKTIADIISKLGLSEPATVPKRVLAKITNTCIHSLPLEDYLCTLTLKNELSDNDSKSNYIIGTDTLNYYFNPENNQISISTFRPFDQN
ncbi:MAG: hypothetical protein K1X29_05600 [Bdellovibrionales bacterium]|nr:hypothetical protein [Bdellovibrionales bacterium]